jgi:cytochrome c biogenesis protein CcdA
MTGLPTATTILAGFPAGFVALLAPCCFGVLLAAYFSRFAHERDRMVRMTLVFAAGIWLVYLIPTLGFSALASAFLVYHDWIYKAGGVFMLILAGLLLLGHRVMLPKPAWLAARSLEGQRPREAYDYASVLGLGFTAGLSTLCCAPVLAAVMALSAAPGSMLTALATEVYFVLGMTLPLFLIAIVADREGLRRRLRDLQKRPALSYQVRSRRVALTWGDMLAATLYADFGLAMVFVVDGMGVATSQDFAMNLQTIRISAWLQTYTSFLPLWLVIAFPVVLIGIIYLIAMLKEKYGEDQIRETQTEPAGHSGHDSDGSGTDSCCH